MINCDEYESVGTNWIALLVTGANATEIFPIDSKIAKMKNLLY